MVYKAWLASKSISNKDKERINAMSKAEKADAFGKIINFGTAGIRGIMDVGTNRINVYTVAHVSQAIADLMKNKNQKKIVLACDVRNNSKLFMDTSVNIFLLNGLDVYIFDSVVPISLLSFAVANLKCDFGIYITASHNPKEYNGYKVFDKTGCQINEKIAAKINEYRDKIEILNKYEKSERKPLIVSDIIYKSFIKAIKKCKIHDFNNLNITYSGLYGTGNGFVDSTLKMFGFTVNVVQEEAVANGDFPGLDGPNPENEKVFARALQIAKENKSDIIIATDPDADRLGVMVYHKDEYVKLTGNQIGVLLANYLSKYKKIKNPYIVFSDVSTDMAKSICKKNNTEAIIVPTGFKYIGAKINEKKSNFIFGFEESCGYLVGPYIRDKDSVGASVLIAEMAAFYKNKNMTLIDELEKLYSRYGYFIEKTYSFPLNYQPSLVNMLSFIASSNYGFNKLNLREDMLYLEFRTGSSITFRMSGTEPKMKVYLKVIGDTKESAQLLLNDYFKLVSDIQQNLEI